MTAFIIDERGNGHVLGTRRRNPFEAVCDLFERVGCCEVVSHGTRKEPPEVTAEWLMRHCREVTTY